MIVTIHPDPAMKGTIYTVAFSLLLCIAAYAFIWLKYKKLPLFTPIALEDMRQLKVDSEPPVDNLKTEVISVAASEKGW